MLPDDGRVVSNFIVQALEGRDITIYLYNIGILEPRSKRDLFDAFSRRFKRDPRCLYPRRFDIGGRRHAGLVLETAGEGALGQSRSRGKCRHGQRVARICEDDTRRSGK